MNKRFLMLASLISMLASCQTVTNEAPAASAPVGYSAHGTEPFWSLHIDSTVRSLRFSEAGGDDIFGDAFTLSSIKGGQRYTSRQITAEIVHATCSNGMSDQLYRDQVSVNVGGKTFKGCGGGVLPPETLEKSKWRIVYINGAEIPAAQGASVEFADSRMSATVGCNRMGGSYQFFDGKLSFGPIMSTRMGCPEPIDRQEQSLANVLGTMKATSFSDDGAMNLTGADGVTIILYRSI
jgi:heat shock protein HslJ